VKLLYTLTATFLFCSSLLFAEPLSTKHKYTECKRVLNGVNFSVDPRIELFHTVEVIQGVPFVNFVDLDYKQKIASHFQRFRAHSLFVFLDKKGMYRDLFNTIDAPIIMMLHLTPDLEWRKDIAVPESKSATLDSLRMLMKDFAEKSDYATFFNSNADLYNISLATLTYNLPGFDEKNRLMTYCGNNNTRGYEFNVILNFLGWGNFGPRIFNKDSAQLYAVIAPEKSAIRVPTFDISALYRLLWHEFAHSFANPAEEKVEKEFDKFEQWWEPVKEPMKAQAYHSWQSVVKEHLTEAIACRMAALKFGEDAAELNYVRPQKGKRWIYLNPLLKALKYYEGNRHVYPTLDSFMPKIIEAFQGISQQDVDRWLAEAAALKEPNVKAMPTVGAIYDTKNILIIVSSNEADRAADQQLKDFINRTKERIKPLQEATIVADTTALKMDLTNYNLSVWGTPGGNKFLQKYLPQIPIIVDKDKVIGETVYQGTGYGVLIGWVNPFNTEKVMAIYTGQNPANLVDFNRIMNGSGNYHIFKNFITIKQSSFSRNGSVWVAR
jgi:hypothetical protein